MQIPNQKFFRPDYAGEKQGVADFITNYNDQSMKTDEKWGQAKYMAQLQKIADKKEKRIEIFIEDLREYYNNENDKPFLNAIENNTMRYQQLFSEIVDDIMPEPDQNFIEDNVDQIPPEDILNYQRRKQLEGLQNREGQNQSTSKLHPLLDRRFELVIIHGGNSKIRYDSIRGLTSKYIGALVAIQAIVVKVSDVKPQMRVATYVCDKCGSENYQTITTRNFAPLVECVSESCKINKMKGKLTLNPGQSKFVTYQELKIHETTSQIPQGTIPKSFNVICKGDLVRQCSPGDLIKIQGIYMPVQQEGFKVVNSLIMETYIDCFEISREKKRYVEFELNEEIQQNIEQFRSDNSTSECFEKLSKSIAPEIYGMEYVKKALLLLMVGGTTLKKADGMNIRGDINIALFGDPGIAKSQLLKHIVKVSPRAVYTTGKGSSGVGLTASVTKDPQTNEISLEGGALVLADMGVCCIDEFDKMNEFDRTSIHEVMEQQTVSIAKAGITTSLNARTSILAAANPQFGRYNKKRSPHENLNMPAALLSRFDLIFILLDKPDSLSDMLLAQHIGMVHRNKIANRDDGEKYLDSEFLRQYVARAKQYNPDIPLDLHKIIIDKYDEKRKAMNTQKKEGFSYTTPRTLLGIIRLAQAHAKLRFDNMVSSEDIDVATELMNSSQESVQDDDEIENKQKLDAVSMVWNIVKDHLKKQSENLSNKTDLQAKVSAKNFSNEDLDKAIQKYSDIGVLNVAHNQVIGQDTIQLVQ